MAFKLQLTDEMIRFFRLPQLSDADAGCLIRLLIDAAEEQPLPAEVPQHLTFTLPIFLGQIEAFRQKYEHKVKGSAERMRRMRRKEPKESEEEPEQQATSVNVTRNTRNTRCNALDQTIPDQTRPKQNKPEQTESFSRSFEDGIDSYDHIFDPRNDPVAMAVGFCQESRPRMAASGYLRQLDRIGDAAFRAVLAAFWGEIQAGEEPRNRGAAFTARLKEQTDFDPHGSRA